MRGGELDEENFRRLAEGFALYLQRRQVKRVVVGHDNRRVSPEFARIACAVLVRRGFTVYDVGLCITPAAYFAQYHLSAPGLMMVTASHNPNDWCGCKLGDGLSKTLNTAEIRELYQCCLSAAEKPTESRSDGKLVKYDIRPYYIEDILQLVQIPANNLRLVVDAGNGAAGIYAWELFQRLGVLTFQLNCDLDDDYPNYFPNPSDIAARQCLKKNVQAEGVQADLGIAFDGDGDRLGVVDGEGNDIWSDRVLMVLAADFLRRYPGGGVVFDVKCTNALAEVVAAAGGRPIMWKTGHSHIKEKLKQEKALLAGERSGHIFINAEGRGYDDALYAAALLLKILAERGKTLSELLREFPVYATSTEIRIPTADAEKYLLVEKLQKYFCDEYGAENVCLINGARVRLAAFDGWALVRASSNLPELVVIGEAATREKLQHLLEFFRGELEKNGICGKWENIVLY